MFQVHLAELLPYGSANAVVSTIVDGTIIGGTYRLSYMGQTTSDLNYDASSADVQNALEALSTIGTVDVTRSVSDYQRGYAWSVTFTGVLNSGRKYVCIYRYIIIIIIVIIIIINIFIIIVIVI